MECQVCGTRSPEAARFCMGCGAALAATCPACQQSNPPGARFCIACGSSLTGQAAITSVPTVDSGPTAARNEAPRRPKGIHLVTLPKRSWPRRDALQGERKQVTVLFADVVGSTELIGDRDPEDAQRLLDGAVQRMVGAVHRYEGTVSRLQDDGLMALFGAPIAHEDHALRACYAAMAMLETIRGYAAEVREADSAALQLRVGLNSGEVIVRLISDDLHMDYTAMGQTVHLAARMEQSAEPGTIRLTTETLALAEGQVQVRSIGAEQVRGLADPIEIYELLGADSGRTRLQAAASRGLTQFVGRQAEAETLRAVLGRARAGQGQIAALVGEPGVGKSRLVWEMTRTQAVNGTATAEPAAHWQVLETCSVSYGTSTPYLPITSLLRAWGRIEPRDDPATVAEKLTAHLRALDPALESVRAALLALLDAPVEDAAWQSLEPPRRRSQTIDAVKRLLLRESQARPLLLVFEDLHWLDAESQALLDELAESLPTYPIFMLVTYRPEYRHEWGSKSFYTQVRVDALPPASAEELLRSLLGTDDTLDPLKRHLIEHTDGNPFFLEESVRALVETGALVGELSAYQLTQDVPAIRVPATVQAVLAARVDRLMAADKRLLQMASVIGKDIPLVLLQAVAGLSEAELQGGLARLRSAELMYETSLFPEPEYTFKHALTHEVAYGSLLLERRRGLHRQVVEAIEYRYQDRLAEQVERLGHHATRGEVWEKALIYCRQAGTRDLARSALRDAATWFEGADAALRQLPESREVLEQSIDISVNLRRALNQLGEGRRAFGFLEAAEQSALRLGDHRRLARVLVSMNSYLYMSGNAETALVVSQRALTIATDLGDHALQAAILHCLGQDHFARGDFHLAVDHFTRALEHMAGERGGRRELLGECFTPGTAHAKLPGVGPG